jgi:hypothetical protein
VDAEGTPAFRVVTGATCDEVVSGIALVVALAIDAEPAQPEPAPLPQPRAEPTAPATANRAPPVATPVLAPPKAPAAPTKPEPASSSLIFEAGARAGYASHRSPSGAWSVEGFFGVGLGGTGPSARLGPFYFASDATTSDGQEATFQAYGAHLEVCPLSLSLSGLTLEPCAGSDLGVVRALGLKSPVVVQPYEARRGIWDGFVGVRLGAPLWRGLRLEAQGELSIPFLRPRYGFGTPPRQVDLFRAPPLGFCARAGLAWRFL